MWLVELLEISERDKVAVLTRVANSINPITDNTVWDKTIDEVNKGWLKGILTKFPIIAHPVDGLEWCRALR